MKEKWTRAKAALKEFFLVSFPRGFRARWYYLLVVLGVIVCDQVSKRVIVATKPAGVVVIPYILNFTYITNDGAAWGMLDDHRWVFMVMSVIGIAAFSLYLFGKKRGNRWIDLGLAFVIGGGIGNMIDRVFLGEVVDFLEAAFMNFPIFNVADSFVCVGAAILLVALVADIIREEKRGKEQKTVSHEGDDEAPGDDTDGRG